jgi:beta-galactosidase
MGVRDWSSLQEYAAQLSRSTEAFQILRTLDPTRPIFSHFGAYTGDVYTSNLYLNFIPLQEREEWMSHWASHGSMPFMAVEFGTPFWSSWTRGRNGFVHSGSAEVFLSEWASCFLGSEAYQLEPEAFRELLGTRFKGGNLQKEYDPVWWYDKKSQIFIGSEGFQRVQDLFINNTWRSWRAMGVSGGMIPWDNGTTSKLLPKLNGPTLAFIAGAKGMPGPNNPGGPAFTEKNHHYAPGQKIEKQAALLNDSRSSLPYSFTWTATLQGQQLERGSGQGTLAVSEHLFVPIAFTTPEAQDAGDGQLKLEVQIGDDRFTDEFAYRVYPKVPQAKGDLLAFDPAGDTSTLLRALGYTIRLWTAGEPPTGSTVIIGRRALSGDGRTGQKDLPADLTRFIHDGGRVLVFGQDRAWTQAALQLRVANTVNRRSFVVGSAAAHPMVAGLDEKDFADWSGAGTLVDGYPWYPGLDWTLRYGWRWGNRGSVSSAMIEKPHRSSWRPILEGEFDLAYSPLMEMEFGRGRVVLCTLDLEGRVGAADPLVPALARRIVEYTRTAPIAAKAKRVIYVGGDEGARLLTELGVVFDRNAGKDSDGSGCLIAGEGADEQTLQAFAEKGGRVVVLPQRRANGFLGTTLVENKKFHGVTNVPDWPEAAGLSPSDLHARADISIWQIQPTAGLDLAADGLLGRRRLGRGTVTFVQMSPNGVAADEKRYLRFTRWRQTRALSQVLANSGVTFTQDAAFLKLLAQPDHRWTLAKEWDVQLTVAKPESPTRQWNADPGISRLARSLVEVNAPDQGWERKPVPAYLESYGGEGSPWRWTDGECVFRTILNDLPARLAGREAMLSLGRVDETESSFINGTAIGSSTHWILPRAHGVPSNVLRPGRNVIAVRTWDQGIHGGMCGDPSDLFLKIQGPDIGLYHPDYLSDELDPSAKTEAAWKSAESRRFIADNPYRYYRW